MEEGDWNLDELLKQLEREIGARERATMGTIRLQSNKHVSYQLEPQRRSSNSSNCCYCQQAHFSGECNVVTNPSKRKQILTTTTMCTNNMTTLLLQTARADVYNPLTPQSLIKVRLLLDSGSQRSHVTNRFARIPRLTHFETAEDADIVAKYEAQPTWTCAERATTPTYRAHFN